MRHILISYLMRFKLLAFIALLSVKFEVFGQNKSEINIIKESVLDCGFLENPALIQFRNNLIGKIYSNNESQDRLRSSTKRYKVPVVVHVIEPGKSSSILSDEAIMEGIANLNNAYSGKGLFEGSPDTGIEFELARFDPDCSPTTGITRFDASNIGWYVKDGLPKGTTSDIENWILWDKKSYLNIWIVSRITGGQVTGYASPQFGAVINSLFFSDGITAHEVGHFLGLAHTFPEYGSNCKCGDGDGLKDTPEMVSFGIESTCPHQWDCEQTVMEKINPCTGKAFGLIQKNIMNYTNCQTIFTKDQTLLIQKMLESYHAPLLTSNALKSNPKPVADISGDSIVYLTKANISAGVSIQPWCSCNGKVTKLTINENEVSANTFVVAPKLFLGESTSWKYNLTCDNSATTSKIVTYHRVGLPNIQSKCTSSGTYSVTFDNPQNYFISSTAGTVDGNKIINIPNSKEVTLRVTAPDGTTDSVEIAIPCCSNKSIVSSKCTPTSKSTSNGDYGIENFTFGNNINNSSSSAAEDGSYYLDFACSEQATINSGDSYSISVRGHSTNKHFVKIYIDYNGDGDFEDINETVLSGITDGGADNIFVGKIVISSSASTERKLRLRVLADAVPIQNACTLYGSADNVSAIGQIEDYSIFVNSPIIIGDLRLNPSEIKATRLTWTSPWKSGVLGFEIQRSLDKSSFETLAIVDFALSKTTAYEYLDEPVNAKQYSYRIKQIKLNGSSQDIPSLVTEKQHFSELPFVFPNPVTENQFILTLPDAKSYKIDLFSESGIYVPINIQGAGTGNEILVIGQSRLSPGLYLLKISNKITFDEKVVKIVIM